MTTKMGNVESQFAMLIWANEPIKSGDLVKLANQELGWKKSTTYTVLRKLCDRGIFRNQESVVTSILNREEYYNLQAKNLLTEGYSGSLPKFIASFIRAENLTDKEIEELHRIIDGNDGR